MIVRALKQFRAPVYRKTRGPQRVYMPGERYEVSGELGEHLVREGLAEDASSTERKVVDAGTSAAAAQPVEESASEGLVPEDDPSVSPDPEEPRLRRVGTSSWYVLPNGDRINGRKNALEALDE